MNNIPQKISKDPNVRRLGVSILSANGEETFFDPGKVLMNKEDFILIKDSFDGVLEHTWRLVYGTLKRNGDPKEGVLLVRRYGAEDKVRWPADDLLTYGMTITMNGSRYRISSVLLEAGLIIPVEEDEEANADSEDNNASHDQETESSE